MKSSETEAAVDVLLGEYPPPIAATVYELRKIVMEAMPQGIERVRAGWRLIGYDVPIGRRNIYLAWIWPQIEHVHLGWQVGTLLRDPRGLLGGADEHLKKVRYLTFEPGKRINPRAATSFTREAVSIATMSRGERELLSASRRRTTADG